MKKLVLVILFGVLACGLALAQAHGAFTGTATGVTNYAPQTDVQGAHENGGRGCAGCHAPHSGGRGSGGNIISTSASRTPAGAEEGDNLLWGTDTMPIQTGYATIMFDGSYPVTLKGLTWSSGSLYTGVATCLSCHDGNVSKGAMMSGQAYEQSFGLLNFATNAGSNGQAPAVSLYGNQPIPTLLGNDFGVAGDYANDHPVGPLANLGAVGSAALNATTGGMIVTFTGTNNSAVTIGATPSSPYANFISSYGTPAINNLANPGDGVAGNLYVVCTTCHNQHVQNVYSALAGGSPIFGGTVTSAATIFYVNGPYNPGAPYDPTHVPSTNRFCLQCHFDHASEYFGATGIGTAF